MNSEETRCLDQKIRLKGAQKFVIGNDGNIEITTRKAFAHRQFKLPVSLVVPDPERILKRQPGDLVGFVFFTLLALALVVPIIVSKDSGMVIVLGFPTLLFGILAGSCLWRWKFKSIDVTVFHLRGGGQLNLWHELPDAESFHKFCKTLTAKAQEAWKVPAIEPSPQSFAGEIAALKKLKDSGVLDESEFARAKAKLLGDPDPRRIGFI